MTKSEAGLWGHVLQAGWLLSITVIPSKSLSNGNLTFVLPSLCRIANFALAALSQVHDVV